MRESRSDTARAVGLAVLLHVLLFGLIFVGMWWSSSSTPQSAQGSPVSADVIDPDALSAADQRALDARPEPVPQPEPEPVTESAPEPLPEPLEEPSAAPPQPLPEPRPEDAQVPPQAAPQEVIPDPAPVAQQEVRRDSQNEEAREREQEEKRRQEQIELAEQQKQAEAEQKRRLARQELEQIRAERARNDRQASLAEQRLKQIADREAQQASSQRAAASSSAASPPPGTPDGDSGLAAKYAAALQEAIRRSWTRPDNVSLGQKCRISITQLPGGEVIGVEFDASCPYDAQGRRSVEAAVRRAEPLPYAGFESVFNRRLNLNFTAQD